MWFYTLSRMVGDLEVMVLFTKPNKIRPSNSVLATQLLMETGKETA